MFTKDSEVLRYKLPLENQVDYCSFKMTSSVMVAAEKSTSQHVDFNAKLNAILVATISGLCLCLFIAS